MKYYIKSLKEIEAYNLRSRDTVMFQCSRCAKLQTNDVGRLKQKGVLLCGDCQKAKTNIEKFGYSNPFNKPSVKEKRIKAIIDHKDEIQTKKIKTLQKHYNTDKNVTNPMQIDECKEKCIQANKYNHNGIMWQQTETGRKQQSQRMLDHPEYQLKSVETNKKNHNGVHYLASQINRSKLLNVVTNPIKKIEIRKTREKTNLELYNNPQPFIFGSSEYISNMIDKIKIEYTDVADQIYEGIKFDELCAILYSSKIFKNKVLFTEIKNNQLDVSKLRELTFSNVSKLMYTLHPEWIKKAKETNLIKYNRESYVGSEQWKTDMINKYGSLSVNLVYNYYGVTFQSSWELAVWIYYVDHNVYIIREPTLLTYTNPSTGSLDYYIPDFYIEGIGYIEIKGDQFFDNNGNMINPYDSSLNNLYESKHQCGINNGVIFWTSKDIKPYIEYCNNMYGKEYLKLFKSNNPYNPTYSNPNGYYNITKPYSNISIYYTPLLYNNTNNKIDNDGYIILDNTSNNKGITPYDIGRKR